MISKTLIDQKLCQSYEFQYFCWRFSWFSPLCDVTNVREGGKAGSWKKIPVIVLCIHSTGFSSLWSDIDINQIDIIGVHSSVLILHMSPWFSMLLTATVCTILFFRRGKNQPVKSVEKEFKFCLTSGKQ